MATDTAFALGVLTIVRKHIPVSLLAFIVGLAIVDDVGAILVIAIFYTQEHSLIHLSGSPTARAAAAAPAGSRPGSRGCRSSGLRAPRVATALDGAADPKLASGNCLIMQNGGGGGGGYSQEKARGEPEKGRKGEGRAVFPWGGALAASLFILPRFTFASWRSIWL